MLRIRNGVLRKVILRRALKNGGGDTEFYPKWKLLTAKSMFITTGYHK